ncbi:sulfotransferase family 2 domain-containing protein [Ideonella dechloratans]|uniref:sulfotransferase family 2 domain-containing protein n=1 Tax=Ideonella dechloratans TaxID=36863 RepID=UPI001B87CEE1|nr:sulfotransferase family 2 domain-containing protein [Ideonella dechloratans]
MVSERLRDQALAVQLPLTEAQEQLLTLESGWLTGLEQLPTLLRPKLVRPSIEDARVKLVRLEGIPPLLPRGERSQASGIVLFDSTEPAELEMVQSGESTVLAWPRPSPALASKWPDLPAARQARLSSVSLLADAKSPVHLRLRSRKGEEVPVLNVEFREYPSPAVNGIFLAQWSIGYQSIPKVACTSLKEALFLLATGENFGDRKRPGGGYIHDYFFRHEQDIAQAAWRFVVVRDPIQRFLSGFSNRVLHYRELSREYLASLPSMSGVDLEDFPANPSLDQFIANFEFYCQVPTIRHHFSPISAFVAPLESFSRVYAFHEIDALAADISKRTGQEFRIPHSQQGGPKLKLERLGGDSLRRLVKIYEADYEMLKHFYLPPSR